jgi:hypothetical protein
MHQFIFKLKIDRYNQTIDVSRADEIEEPFPHEQEALLLFAAKAQEKLNCFLREPVDNKLGFVIAHELRQIAYKIKEENNVEMFISYEPEKYEYSSEKIACPTCKRSW